jgi:hypothetical protein
MLRTTLHKLGLQLAIIQELMQVGACTFDELCERLPIDYSWDEVFSAVDQLRREGTVTLQRAVSLDYIISLTPRRTAEAHYVAQV